jgi:CubicO group peptidase (beta-lactamase class C family)
MNATFFSPRRHSARRASTWLLLAATLGLAAATQAAPPPGEIPPGAVTEMDQIVSRAFPAEAPGVAVLVVQNGEIKLRKGYGMADLEQGTRVDPANVFRLCSITKQFTAVAILQLVEAGKLGLDDDIQKYLPDYPARGAKITVVQLLDHTAGIPDVDLSRPEWKKRWAEGVTADEFLAATNDRPLDFAPGSDWKYSNNGYALLGKIIEKVSGERYADYVQKHLFTPANMKHSYYADSQPIISGRIPGYSRSGKNWVNALPFSMTGTYSGGALLSTVDDMWSWEQALQAGRLVKTDLLAKARTEVFLPDGRGSHYGLGWEVDRLGDHPMTCHGGGIPGYSSFELSVPDAGLHVVALANTESPRIELRLLATRLARAALGLPSAAALVPIPVPAEELEAYVGDYRVSEGAAFKVTLKDGVLSGQLGRGGRRLISTAKDEFIIPENEILIKFVRGATGQVVNVSFRSDAPGPDLIWPRIIEKTQDAHVSVHP